MREKEQKNGIWAPGIIKNKVLSWKFHSKNKNKNSGTISGKSLELSIPSGNIFYSKIALQRKSWHLDIYVFGVLKAKEARLKKRCYDLICIQKRTSSTKICICYPVIILGA